MRIGLVAPPWLAVPPESYGGTEAVVDNLARGLSARGHEVVLWTIGTSTCPVTRRYLYELPPAPIGTALEEAAHVLAGYRSLTDVDIIHDHTTLGVLLAPLTRAVAPMVSTQHGPFTAVSTAVYRDIARRAAVVAISHAQAERSAGVPIRAVIHHGIDLDCYSPGPGGGGYLLFVGRMSPEKGVRRAIEVARRAGRHLVIVTKMREQQERDYFDAEVGPLLHPDVEIVFEPDFGCRLRLLQHADALLDPIAWQEPFGLVMAEALAVGTPVLVSPLGAAPEIVDHRRTGFLCESDDEFAEAIQAIPLIDRDACRRAAEQRFSQERMAADHEALYERLIDEHPLTTHHLITAPTGQRRSAEAASSALGR